MAYTLAGADCVDVAADPAVILAAKEAFQVALAISRSQCVREPGVFKKPLLMVSLNDGEDPHFRKAEFPVANCPPECDRPCEAICPANAIVFQPTSVATKNSLSGSKSTQKHSLSGVVADRCYGCGRCMPICPIQHISTRSYVSTPQAIAPLILQAGVDAIEIHTQVGRLEDFRRLWAAIAPWADQLKLIAISCPDGNELIDYLWALYDTISPISCPLIWQTDGRPMSGDIGIGATRAAVKLGQKVLTSGLPGYVQVAGGTNQYTVPKLRSLGLLKPDISGQPIAHFQSSTPSHRVVADSAFPFIAGVAYGSYARSLLSPMLEQLEMMEVQDDMMTTLLWQAVNLAHSLVSQLKPTDATQPLSNPPKPLILSSNPSNSHNP